jgi:putative CRISPR-associated protein (TIGR02619 family)
MKKYVLSPCGTSLFTNQSSDVERKTIFDYANHKSSDGIPADGVELLKNLRTRRSASLKQAAIDQAARLSAELNGIIRLYEGDLSTAAGDHHTILCTDTWIGNAAADTVAEWLKQKGLSVEVFRQPDLQTADLQCFQSALSDLVKKFSEEIPSYRDNGYHVVFNLTGGFKSVQGFLQSIANFYADETVYIFESAQELLRIPRLPIRLAAKETVQDNLRIFRRLAAELPVSDTQTIPETLLFKLDNETGLSPWGSLVWEQTRPEIYEEKVFEPPSDRIAFSRRFQQDVQKLPSDRTILVNQRLDQLARCLESGSDSRFNPPSLDFKPVQGKAVLPSTHEMDAWSDKDAKRIFGHFENDVFVLDQLGKKLY